MTAVKICGLRTLDDARAAVAAGADIISFIFFPGSRRFIVPEKAAAIIAALRAEPGVPAAICGLFVNATVSEVRETAARCGLDVVQLAGDEVPEVVAMIGLPVLKTFRPEPGETATALIEQIVPYRAAAGALPPGPWGGPFVALIDAAVPGQYGGTGQTADWDLCAAVGGHLPGHTPLMLAGGLTPDNVGAAVRNVQPWAVDVASGVEQAPGVKDVARMRAFVNAVRAADEEGRGADERPRTL